MALELCYTSSPQGLLPGANGYCTVAASEALTPQMIQALESLSGYRPMFGVGDPEAVNNPTAFSNVRAPVAGVTRSVLSRVAYAGADYSGRINKFAHHLLPSDDEIQHVSPAWVLSQPGVMRDSWEGSPRRLPQPRTVPAGEVDSKPCTLWEEATTDAGWAGFLVEHHLLNPAEPIYLVYDPTQHDALALTAEAIALLPGRRRWGVTFTTYFTDPIAGAECGWRWVVTGSAMAERILAGEINGRIINLTEPLGQAPESRYTHAARNGGETEPGPETVGVAVPAAPATPPPSIAPAEPLTPPSNLEVQPKVNSTPPPQAPAKPLIEREPLTPATRSNLPKLVGAAAVGAVAVWGGFSLIGAPEGAVANRPQATSVVELENELADSRSYAALLEKENESLRSRLNSLENVTVVPGPTTQRETAPTPNTPKPVLAFSETVPIQAPRKFLLEADPSDTATATALEETSEISQITRTYRSLIPPTLQRQNDAGLGVLARLNAQTQSLWQASSFDKPVTVSVQTPTDTPAGGIYWMQNTSSASVIHRAHNSLGISRQHTLGEARINNGELEWTWLAEVFQPEDKASSQPLTQLHALVSYAVLTVEDDAGRTLAEIQPSEPRQIEAAVGQSAAVVPADALAFPAEFSATSLPLNWNFIANPADPPLRLRGVGGAEIILDYIDSTGEFSPRWSAKNDPPSVADRLSKSIAEADGLQEILAGWREREDNYARARARLPRQEGSEDIDHERRGEAAWEEDFMAYDKSADARDRYLADYAPQGLDEVRSAYAKVNQRIEKDRSLQKDIDAFDNARLRLSITASSADLAFLTITPEVRP
ncbi:MAG: hypothetical protein AAGH99_13210 [Planctomycetota bacterium]